MIRSTLTAVPARGAVLAAKAVVMALVLFFTSLAIFLAAAIIVSPIFADTAGAIDWASFDGTYLPILVASASMPQGLAILDSQPVGEQRLLRQVGDYSMPNVSEKVVRIIHSYVDYVNRVVWKRY